MAPTDRSPLRAPLFLPSRAEVAARYRVRALAAPRAGAEGVEHLEGGRAALLPWSRVQRALAAEIGEPQGVRTVVFDLVVGAERDGGFEVARFDAESDETAVAAARALARALPAGRLSAAVRALASEGRARDWFPDLAAFEEAALAALAARIG